jgi:hypothetical protein
MLRNADLRILNHGDPIHLRQFFRGTANISGIPEKENGGPAKTGPP